MGRKPSYRDKARFYREFASLYDSGMPVQDILPLVKVPRLRRPLADLRIRLSKGEGLGSALSAHKSAFSEIERGILAMGEESGRLVSCAENLADWFEMRHRVRSEIISGLYYPGFIIHVAPIVGVLPSLILDMCFTCMFRGYLMALAPLYIAIVIFFVLVPFLKSLIKPLGFLLDGILLWIPIFGKTVRKLNLARFSLALSYSLDAGVDTFRSLQFAQNTVTNRAIRKNLTRIAPAIREGASFTQALRGTVLMDPVAEGLINAGEVSGNQVAMLKKLHEYFLGDFQTTIARIMKVLPLLSLLLVAVLIGFQMVEFYSALFTRYEEVIKVP